MKGIIDTLKMKITYYELKCFGIIGKYCFQTKMTGEGNSQTSEFFDNDKCFYGNTNVEIDTKNYKNSFLKGTFKEVNLKHLLMNFLEISYLSIYNYASKHIVAIKFEDYVRLYFSPNYNFKNSNNNNKNNNNNNNNNEKNNQNGNLTPKGITFNGRANFLGISGNLVLNIDQNDLQLNGIFHTVLF